MLNLRKIADKAIETKPPVELLHYCGQHYSPYYHLMYLLSKQFKGKLAVELGVESGRGSTALALGGMFVIGIDHTWRDEINTVTGLYDNFVFIQMDSMPVPPIVEGKKISLLHIDTEHSYAQAKEEFNAYKRFLVDGAVVLFDDLHAMEDEVMRFFNELPYEKLADDRLHPSCGYGFILYEEGK